MGGERSDLLNPERDTHHHQGVAEWKNVLPENRNPFQRLAAKTHGIITPGNIISALGLGLTALGSYKLSRGKDQAGILLIGAGRVCDVLDGYAAHLTKTKSPLGEGVDATLDKLAIAVCVPALIKRDIITKEFAKTLFAQNLANAGLTVVAKARGNEIHSGIAGKDATFESWVAIGAAGLARVALERGHEGVNELLQEVSDVFQDKFMLDGTKATIEYLGSATGQIDMQDFLQEISHNVNPEYIDIGLEAACEHASTSQLVMT